VTLAVLSKSSKFQIYYDVLFDGYYLLDKCVKLALQVCLRVSVENDLL